MFFFYLHKFFFIEVLAAQCDKDCRKGNIEYRYIEYIVQDTLSKTAFFANIVCPIPRAERNIINDSHRALFAIRLFNEKYVMKNNIVAAVMA